MTSESSLEAKGLFSGLFDFSFTTFITLKFLRVIYIVLLVLITLTGLVFLIRALSEGGTAAVIGLVLVPLVTLLYIVLARIYMELIALFFRIGENTSLLVTAAGRSFGGPGGGYGGPAGGYGGPAGGYGGPPPPYAGGPGGGPPT